MVLGSKEDLMQVNRNYVYGYEMPWLAKTLIICKGRIFIGPPKFRWLSFLIVFAITGLQFSIVYSSGLFV